MRIILLSAFVFIVGVVARIHMFYVDLRGSRLQGDIQMLSHHEELMMTLENQNDNHILVMNNETATKGSSSLWNVWNRDKPEKVFGRAKIDSNGFFDMIPDDEWKEMKRETKLSIDMQDGIMMR